MPEREIKLETAAFLDSPQFRGLSAERDAPSAKRDAPGAKRDAPGSKREDARKIVDAFLACAYDEIGIAPRLLDGEHMHAIVGHLLPGHFGRKDPLAAGAMDVVRAYVEFLKENAVVIQAFEIQSALEATAAEFKEAVRTGASAHHAPRAKDKPFIHRADKVGRNDPCPCGSGKKFKQCCARLGA